MCLDALDTLDTTGGRIAEKVDRAALIALDWAAHLLAPDRLLRDSGFGLSKFSNRARGPRDEFCPRLPERLIEGRSGGWPKQGLREC